MFEVGRMCVKIAGRDAGKKCVITEVLDKNYVLIDGETRRRKCNVTHLEPLNQTIIVSAKRDHADIAKEFEKLGLKPWKTNPKQKANKPVKLRKNKKEVAAKVSDKKKPAKK